MRICYVIRDVKMYSSNWVAYCKANNLSINHTPHSNVDFICWINKKAYQFRKLHGVEFYEPIGKRNDWIDFLFQGG
jgi:hypothetical protein